MQYIQKPNCVEGACEQLISENQKKWRGPQLHENYPFLQIAKYVRNAKYAANEVRSLCGLQKSLKYIYQNHLPRLLDFFSLQKILASSKDSLNQPSDKVKLKLAQKQKQHFLSFIYERIKAIKKQYFVQGIIHAKQHLKILKITILVESLRKLNLEKGYINNQQEMSETISTLELILLNQEEEQNFKALFKFNPNQYEQYLAYAILIVEPNTLIRILAIHNYALQNEFLKKIVALRLKIKNYDYQYYIAALNHHQNQVIRLILIDKIINFREIILSRIAKSKISVPKLWLNERLLIFTPQKDKQAKIEDHKSLLIQYQRYLNSKQKLDKKDIEYSVQALKLDNIVAWISNKN